MRRPRRMAATSQSCGRRLRRVPASPCLRLRLFCAHGMPCDYRAYHPVSAHSLWAAKYPPLRAYCLACRHRPMNCSRAAGPPTARSGRRWFRRRLPAPAADGNQELADQQAHRITARFIEPVPER